MGWTSFSKTVLSVSPPTLLIDRELIPGECPRVEGSSFRHLFRARRLAMGDALRVVDGRGRAFEARVESVSRTVATIALGRAAESLEPDFDLEILVATPRLERATILVEKATELGVSAVRFFTSERTPREYAERNLERLRRVAGAAVEQCGRSRRPLVDGVHPWSRLGSMVEKRQMRWVLSPGGGLWANRTGARSGVVIVGPEGGLSQSELEELEGLGCRVVDLGPRILRVETAALAAAALCLLPR